MLEKQLRVKMQDMLADVEKLELRRLDDIGTYRTKRQMLDVNSGDLRQATPGRGKG